MMRCLIEYDGEQHFKKIFSWDTNETLQQRQYYDKLIMQIIIILF